MHYWGDEWFEKNGKDIDDAVIYIATFCHRWGRLGGQAKEKWGSVRFSAKWHMYVQDLWRPGMCFNWWPKWAWRLDCNLYAHLDRNPVRSAINVWQRFIYSLAYLRAIKRWPHLRHEIISDADYKECFPIKLQREANAGWCTSAAPGDIVYVLSEEGYGVPFAVVECSARLVTLQTADTKLIKLPKPLLRFFDGVGVG